MCSCGDQERNANIGKIKTTLRVVSLTEKLPTVVALIVRFEVLHGELPAKKSRPNSSQRMPLRGKSMLYVKFEHGFANCAMRCDTLTLL